MHIIGDVAGRDRIIVDDMIDTGGTLCKAAEALKEHGAKRVFAYATTQCYQEMRQRIYAIQLSTK